MGYRDLVCGAVAFGMLVAGTGPGFAAGPEPAGAIERAEADEPVVAVSDGGRCFHRPECRRASARKRLVPRADAVARGLSPCRVCHRKASAHRPAQEKTTAPADEAEAVRLLDRPWDRATGPSAVTSSPAAVRPSLPGPRKGS